MKTRTSRWIISFIILIAITLLSVYLLRGQLSTYAVEKIANQRMKNDQLEHLPDGLHIGFCGSGSPFPDDERTGPCTVIIAGKSMYVFDAGNTSSRNINNKLRLNTGDIQGIFLTHFHSDHIDGLGELLLQRWVSGGHHAPVPVYGPEGVDKVLSGFMQAYELDRGYRVAHHGDNIVPSSGFGGTAQIIKLSPEHPTQDIIQTPDLNVRAFIVDHSPAHPAYGYKITYKGRSVVLSGDTKKTASVAQQATHSDVLVHEALSPPLVGLLTEAAKQNRRNNLVKITHDILDYHATPEQAAQLAHDAQVNLLILNHITPPLPLPGMEKTFLGKASHYFSGKILVSKDGDFISLPAGSKDIQINP